MEGQAATVPVEPAEGSQLSADVLGVSEQLFGLSFGFLLSFPCLSDQLVHRLVDDLVARTTEPLVADHALVVDEVDRRRAGQVPFTGDGAPARARARVGERPPDQVLLVHDLLEVRGPRFRDRPDAAAVLTDRRARSCV